METFEMPEVEIINLETSDDIITDSNCQWET